MNTPPLVLIIDDDEDFHETIGAVLEAAGYAVTHARSGRQGLMLLEGSPPDAILLDVMMESSTEGYGVNFAIKNLPEYEAARDTPVIMVSNIEETPEQRFPRAEELDLIRPDRYLTKPVDVGRLLELLGEAMQHA